MFREHNTITAVAPCTCALVGCSNDRKVLGGGDRHALNASAAAELSDSPALPYVVLVREQYTWHLRRMVNLLCGSLNAVAVFESYFFDVPAEVINLIKSCRGGPKIHATEINSTPQEAFGIYM